MKWWLRFMGILCITFVVSQSSRLNTYQRVMEFIKVDKTDTMTYGPGFDCKAFTKMLATNAKAEGFEVIIVSVGFQKADGACCMPFGHEFLVFLTVDRGPIWVEPQKDWEYRPASAGERLCTIDGSFCWESPIAFEYENVFDYPKK
jgi:hypothetical protein